jgi:hypothetical protein
MGMMGAATITVGGKDHVFAIQVAFPTESAHETKTTPALAGAVSGLPEGVWSVNLWIDYFDLLVVLYPAHVRSSWPFLALLNRELDAITFA